MENRTATETMMERHRFELGLGPMPHDIETEEDYLKWVLTEIQRKARRDAEPFMQRLVEIESRKPPKPIYIPLDQITREDILRAFDVLGVEE